MRFGVPMRGAGSALFFSALLGMSTLVGCAHTDTVADRHITEMGEQIGKEQADLDKTNSRSGLLDVKPEQVKNANANGGANAKRTDAAGHVVAIGDDDNRENDDPNDPTTRPEIRLQGPAGAAAAQARSSASSSSRKSSSTRDRDRDEPKENLRPDSSSSSSSSSPSSSARPSVLDPEAKRAYDSAHSLVTSKQYDRALEALASFISRWPDHPYAENATYWRGECYFAKGEYLRSAEQFEAVLSRYTGTKAPDALLKIGMCHERLGSSERAKEYWERLRRDYPRSDAVKRIPGDAGGGASSSSSSSSSKTDKTGGSGPR